MVHALLGLETLDDVLGHPVAGPSWEGFVIENLLDLAPVTTGAAYYRTTAGAEIDLVLDLPGGERWAIEIKRSLAPSLGRGFHLAYTDLGADRGFVVYAGTERYPLSDHVEAISLLGLARELVALA
jgi:predicted AAA+ superfamily ATPase